MLLPKPFILLYQHNAKQAWGPTALNLHVACCILELRHTPLSCSAGCLSSKEKSESLATIDEETGPSSNHHGPPVCRRWLKAFLMFQLRKAQCLTNTGEAMRPVRL